MRRIKFTYEDSIHKFYERKIIYKKFNLNIRVHYRNCFGNLKHKWVEVCSVEHHYKNYDEFYDAISSNDIKIELMAKYDKNRKIKRKLLKWKNF